MTVPNVILLVLFRFPFLNWNKDECRFSQLTAQMLNQSLGTDAEKEYLGSLFLAGIEPAFVTKSVGELIYKVRLVFHSHELK